MRWLWLTTGFAGVSAVLVGAFGAHALSAQLTGRAAELWQLASQYHLIHAVALLALCAWCEQGAHPWLSRAAAFLAAGTAVFSGSLYAMALGAPTFLGMITPVGGVLLVLGWACVAVRAVRG